MIPPIYLHLSFAMLLLFLSGCQNLDSEDHAASPILSSLKSPSGPHTEEPNLFTSSSGEVFLSWILKNPGKPYELRFSSLEENGDWKPSLLIAKGSDWFVNWADFPALAANESGHMIAHFLQKSGADTYAYDIVITQSFDFGNTWSSPSVLHDDNTQTEHGFVSILQAGNGFFLTWLDGRNTGSGASHSDNPHGHTGGAMTLRAAFIDSLGHKWVDTQIDDRICDCCQTGAVMTQKGPLVVYRDRSEDEIRDIGILKFESGKWSKPRILYPDNWQIHGCPVNGPKADALGNLLAVAWFTAADATPQVKVIFSSDGGTSFGSPFVIAEVGSVGRVDVLALDQNRAMVSWMEFTDEEKAFVQATEVSKDGQLLNTFTIGETKASRASGFPQMTRSKAGVVFAWTEVDSLPTVKTALLRPH